MLYEVRCSTCDISLAIAGSTLRITSSVTTSSERGALAATSARPEVDHEATGRGDLESIAGTHERRARVLLDDRRAGDRRTARERVAPIDRTVDRRVEPDATDGVGARRFARAR